MEKSVMSVREMAAQMSISLPKAYELVKEPGFPTIRISTTLNHPVNTMYSEEYAESMCRLYLADELTTDEKGKRIRNYRLHAQTPHNIEMALAYDINCPRCGGRLKQVGKSRDSHTLGLYTCKACNRH